MTWFSNEINCVFYFLVSTPSNNSNETHRMKMAASFHQRVVVGEDKPANNNTPRDHHRTPRDSSTSEDRLRVYQEKSREVGSYFFIELKIVSYYFV